MRPSDAMSLMGSGTLGLTLVGFATAVLLCRELLKWIRGHSPDFIGVVATGVVAAALIAVIPALGDQLMDAGNATLASMDFKSSVNFERAFRAGIKSQGDCSQIGTMESLGLLLSVRGWLMIISFLGLMLMMLVKIMVIDIAWKIVFTIVVVLAPISLALGVFTESGYGPLLRVLASISLWPVVFGMLLLIASNTQYGPVLDVAEGRASLGCAAAKEPLDSASDSNADVNDTEGAGIMSWVRFMATTWVMAMLTFKVPEISAWVVGGQAPGAFGMGVVAIVTNPAVGAARSAQSSVRALEGARRTADGGQPSSFGQAATMGAVVMGGIGAIGRAARAPFKRGGEA